MNKDHELLSTDSFGVWYDNELLDGSLSSMDLANATYHEPLSTDALPTRSIGLTGTLSLHDYRKQLAQAAECFDDPVDRSERTIRRKTGTSNLNSLPEIATVPYAVSTSSSVTSTPPPLSPSCSQSILSLRSEQDEVSESGQLQVGALPAQGPRVNLVSEHLTRPRPNRKRLNTFREKLEARGQAQHSPLSRPQNSDPMLATTQAATISHGGTSFEILNPRRSLDFARIVSFIEDVDSCSIFSDQIRDSKLSTFSIDQGLDRASLSQFTDASLPSHYSSQSLYTTSLSSGYSTPKRQTADIPSSSPGVHDRIRSLSDYSTYEHDPWSSDRYEPRQSPNDIIGESPRPRMASISERLEEREEVPSEPNSPSSSPPTYYSGESEIGEPGSPVYANGEWSQVDGRDRGIFLELPPSPYENEHENENPNESIPTSPYNTYLANTMSPAYSPHYDHDPYDPIYFDPHVQSVLAAANAETMGLRGHPARGLDDLQRRFQSSVSLGDKKGDKQRKRLRKFFSWRSGN
ncbi:hypothetical protein N7520_000975 [Penicillium odoratum]|uniref:uncharacterized protein n=1 Tax=Penicillium odoratum TaxID=1167516 RepID=UPI0025467CC5|nr:uncharacterized protein N7520_000975 [Penicillium odoratum]KAJ5777729.1 hypothetical protein N7520_000975 [Penicillium odoratum]